MWADRQAGSRDGKTLNGEMGKPARRQPDDGVMGRGGGAAGLIDRLEEKDGRTGGQIDSCEGRQVLIQ